MAELGPGDVDGVVLGGGIAGAGVARDAALRGLRVVLVDSDDFASGTSHLTSKLIHGGLRYLQRGHVRLVIQAARERERLLTQVAPHLVTPLRIVVPFEWRHPLKWPGTIWGVKAYALLGRLGMRGSRTRCGGAIRWDHPMCPSHPLGVAFWDAQASDARLVMATIRAASAAGACVRNYCDLTAAEGDANGWRLSFQPRGAEREWSVRARCVVNATGPWSPLTSRLLGASAPTMLWIKGTHILVRRPAEFGSDGVIFRSVRDNRALWAIPWFGRIIVGTTESRYIGDLRHVHPTADEVEDLWSSFVHWFPGLPVGPGDVVGAYAGVRPIVAQRRASDNGLSRRHEVDVDPARRLVTVRGGKLTTFRLMAEQAGDAIDRMLGRPRVPRALRARLRGEPIWPGLSAPQIEARLGNLRCAHAESHVVTHLVRHYGDDAHSILQSERAQLAPLFDGLPYTLAELIYLARHESVRHLGDLIKRRTSIYFLAERAGLDQLPSVVASLAPVLGWTAARGARELAAVADAWRDDYELPVREWLSAPPAKAPGVLSGAAAVA